MRTVLLCALRNAFYVHHPPNLWDTLSKEGLSIADEKIRAIRNAEKPRSAAEIVYNLVTTELCQIGFVTLQGT